jgi:hypothetical protein
MPFANIRRVKASRERERSMKRVLMKASELECSVIVRDLASNRSLVSFLRGKDMVKPCSIYSVELRLDGEKAMEVAFSDRVYDEAVLVRGDHTAIMVPAELKAEFEGIVP